MRSKGKGKLSPSGSSPASVQEPGTLAQLAPVKSESNLSLGDPASPGDPTPKMEGKSKDGKSPQLSKGGAKGKEGKGNAKTAKGKTSEEKGKGEGTPSQSSKRSASPTSEGSNNVRRRCSFGSVSGANFQV